jgi:mono/diheme cytochrome c family protein
MRRSAAILLVLLPACTEDDAASDEGSSEDRVSYYEDILPVFAQHCNSCHTEGAVGPFPLDDYASAAEWAPVIAVATHERTMPPYSANNDGTCNTYVDAQWLSDEEIDLIAQWVDEGAIEGDADTPRPDPRAPNVLRGNSIVEIGTPPAYVPVPQTYAGGETEDYQCFLALPSMETERFVIGFDVVPGNTRTVHHVLAFEVDPNFLGNAATMQALDDESPDQLGWDCTGAAGEGVIPEGVPVAWAPGTGAVNFPEGTGIRVEQGHALVIQMHYNIALDNGPDSTIVKLDFADTVEREGRQTLQDPFLFGAVTGNPDQLEPGLEHATYTWEMSLAQATFDERGDREVEVYGVMPHMHQRGNRMSVEFGSPEGMRCGADIDRWDFDWQRIYFYEEPLTMRLSDLVRVTCDWDTRGDAGPVMPGFGTADEMCLLGVYVVDKV